MADRPIGFSPPMVRALLAGTKTQTRRSLPAAHPRFPHHRILRLDALQFRQERPEVWFWDGVHDGVGASYGLRYAAGDRLWVQEDWRTPLHADAHRPTALDRGIGLWFESDGPAPSTFGRHRWRRHMPRWASRITLTVTEVRVQRLQEISEADVLAEGCPLDPYYIDTTQDGSNPHMVRIEPGRWKSPRAWYHDLWNSLHGPDAWDANQAIAAYSFTVRQGNIDEEAR